MFIAHIHLSVHLCVTCYCWREEDNGEEKEEIKGIELQVVLFTMLWLEINREEQVNDSVKCSFIKERSV